MRKLFVVLVLLATVVVGTLAVGTVALRHIVAQQRDAIIASAERAVGRRLSKDSTYSHLHEALCYALVNTVALDHADYFATTADGERPPAELDEDESEFIDSYITGGDL